MIKVPLELQKKYDHPYADSNSLFLFIEKLKNENNVRHYSPKTFRAHSLWAQKLRYFSKDKVPETLDVEDIKAFLTFLAVKIFMKPMSRKPSAGR